MSLMDAIKKLLPKREPQTAAETAPIPAEESGPEQESAPGRWAGDMLPRVTGRGKSAEHSGGGGYMSCATVRLEWVSRETDAAGGPLRARTPKGVALTVPEAGFMAAGRLYATRDQLTARWEGKRGPWAKDVYGRDVLVLTERFPCFDSSDYLYEKRYFRWYFLCRDGKLTCVYHTDNTPFVTVTEDVLDLETQCWEQMEKLDCFGRGGDTDA